MNGLTAYALSKKHTNDTVDGLGYLKGAPCAIKSTTETDDGVVIVFEWTGTSGATQTSSILVKNGEDGQAQSITTARTVDDDGVVITIVNPDGTTASTATIYDGDSGKTTSIDWSKIENRPFVTLNADDFEVDENGILSIVTSGEGNAINTISVNGVNVEIDENKNVDITIPDTTDFITKAVSDLENYYLKTETYTQEEVNDLISAIVTLDIKAVDALPTTDISTKTIYLVANGDTEENNIRDEYICLDATVPTWEKIGSTKVDLTNFYTKDETYSRTEVDEKITEAVTNGTVDLSGYATDEELSDALVDYTKTTDLETKLEDYVLDADIETITVEQIESMIGLNSDEILGLASLLSDQTIELSKTWSSSCIYGKLNETLDSAKAYTLQELSKSIGASYKVVTSVDQMTDNKILYLLKDADSGMYNIYVYDADTSTAELIGTFEVSLDDYMTRTELSDTFVKQTDFEPIGTQVTAIMDGTTSVPKAVDSETLGGLSVDKFAKVDDIANVEISTDENNQLEQKENGLYVGKVYKEVTQAEYDAIENKDSDNILYFITDAEPTNSTGSNIEIVTTLDSSSTDDTVPSAKVVYDEINTVDKKYIINGSLVNNSIAETFASMSDGQIIRAFSWNPASDAHNNDTTDGYHFYELYRANSTYAEVTVINNHLTYQGRWHETNGINWHSQLARKVDIDNINNSLANYFPITGGTISGNRIDLLNGYGHVISGEGFLQFGSKNDVDSSDNMRALIVYNSNAKTLDSSVQLIDKIEGEVTTYDVIHSGNIADYACTTTVVDVPFTEVTLDATKVTKNDDSSYLKYCVKNGVCYLSCYGIKLVSLPTSTNHTVVSVDKLPTPSVYTSCPLQVAAGNASPSTPMFLEVMADGTVRIFSKDSLGAFYGTLSYPVAEN